MAVRDRVFVAADSSAFAGQFCPWGASDYLGVVELTPEANGVDCSLLGAFTPTIALSVMFEHHTILSTSEICCNVD